MEQPEALRLAALLDDVITWDDMDKAAAELRRQHALIAELVEALGRLHASHCDYTDSQQRGWPENKVHGYPDLQWSLEIEQQARAALSKAKES